MHSAILSGANWVEPVCTFASPLMAEKFGNSKVKFRRDPSFHFKENAQNAVKMLLQDLVVIFDEMMT